jgi:EpsI family protein
LQIEGYETASITDMSADAIKMLNLDDYVFANFAGPLGNVNLYIGYYYTANKAYAAHSPLICYPSQGWKIDNKPKKGSLQVGSQTIQYEEIITSLEGTKELVLYWYQAGLYTNTQIYKNKIDMGYNKLVQNTEQHGFIRVAVPILKTYEEAQLAAAGFIKAFYPQFIEYISQFSDV